MAADVKVAPAARRPALHDLLPRLAPRRHGDRVVRAGAADALRGRPLGPLSGPLEKKGSG